MNAEQFVEKYGINKANKTLEGNKLNASYFQPSTGSYYRYGHGSLYVVRDGEFVEVFGGMDSSTLVHTDALKEYVENLNDIRNAKALKVSEFVRNGNLKKAKEVLNHAPEGATHFNNLGDDEYNCYVIIKEEWTTKNKHAYSHKDASTGECRWEFMPNKFAGFDMLKGTIDLEGLKFFVEAWELINGLGGIDEALKVLNEIKTRDHSNAQDLERQALENALKLVQL